MFKHNSLRFWESLSALFYPSPAIAMLQAGVHLCVQVPAADTSN